MANSHLLWVRDACGSTEDQGDTSTTSIDLLWKARSGSTQGSVDPTVLSDITGVEEIDVRSDFRALAGALPDQDITGAIVKRIILNYGFYFAAQPADLPGERDQTTSAGWYEGILTAPWTHAATHLTTASRGHPSDAADSVSIDWIWWSRQYSRAHGYRAYNVGTLPITEVLVYNTIDTRNSRRIGEQGESLYWQWSPSAGQTINGWVASWSVLLSLP